jgi:hypothetical protein
LQHLNLTSGPCQELWVSAFLGVLHAKESNVAFVMKEEEKVKVF